MITDITLRLFLSSSYVKLVILIIYNWNERRRRKLLTGSVAGSGYWEGRDTGVIRGSRYRSDHMVEILTIVLRVLRYLQVWWNGRNIYRSDNKVEILTEVMIWSRYLPEWWEGQDTYQSDERVEILKEVIRGKDIYRSAHMVEIHELWEG